MKQTMETIEPFFKQAQTGDSTAYGVIIQHFQGMAISYAYGVLNDYSLAEDVAQEAFLEAYTTLSKVYSPHAFPSWLRKIIFKHCDRLTRRKRVETIDLSAASRVMCEMQSPTDAAETAEVVAAVRAAIETLPEHERTVALLFYLAQQSHKEIAQFLGVQISTVKNRLHSARKHLKTWFLDTMPDQLPLHLPIDKEAFAMTIITIIEATEQGDLSKLNALLERHPDLVKAKNERPGATALHYAAWSGQIAAAELLLRYGADINLHDDTYDAPPIGWAGENGQTGMFEFLREQGAKLTVGQAAAFGSFDLVRGMIEDEPTFVNDGTGNRNNVWSPLWQAANWQRHDIFGYLLDRGADVNGQTRRGERPLHGAVTGGDFHIIQQLITTGANVNVQADSGYTPLHIAAWHRHHDIVQLLLDHGADGTVVDQHGQTALSLAGATENPTGWNDIPWGYPSPPDEAIIHLLRNQAAKTDE